MKPVQIEDLLGRDPIKTDMDEVFRYITGKVVLVTGVGSIGSELARQIAAHDPKHLILFDIYENNAYDIQQELRKKYPNLKLDTIIGSVRDSRKSSKYLKTTDRKSYTMQQRINMYRLWKTAHAKQLKIMLWAHIRLHMRQWLTDANVSC